MARRPRSSKLEDRTNRLKLPVQKRPHSFTTIAPGIALAYRRCKGAGRWIVRVADGKGSSWQKGFAIADDFEDANGESVLTFWQAQTRAKELARGTVETGRPITVTEFGQAGVRLGRSAGDVCRGFWTNYGELAWQRRQRTV